MLNVPRLRILLELHRRGSLAQVAESMNYSPSAVSQQLSALERETGVQLLEHVGRGVRLTDHALGLVTHAEAVIARLEEAEAELAATQPELRGTLRVASFQTVVVEIAPMVLTLLAQRHPHLQVEVSLRTVDAAYAGLLSHGFDVILGEEFPGLPEPVRDGVDRFDLARDAFRLAVPASGPWARQPVSLGELADVPWALDPADSTAGMWSRTVCRRAGFEPQIRFEGPDPLMHAHLVRSGHTAAFLPDLIVANHARGIELFALPDDPHRMLYTAARSGRAGHPAIRAFRTALGQAAADRGDLIPESAVTW